MTLSSYLRKIENKLEHFQIRNIDFIYIINLDHCPDKFEYCKQQLAPYRILPHRVSGIYGKKLPIEAFNEVGVKLDEKKKPIWTSFQCLADCSSDPSSQANSNLADQRIFDKIYVHHLTTKGQVGCFLSHLSILVDAFESGYQAIWVQEDDFLVKEDPHCLGNYIDRLDSLLGREGWDVLYTDDDHYYPKEEEPKSLYMRPDMLTDFDVIPFHEKVGEDFYQIRGRCGAYSMILSRSGIEKIVNFYRNYNLFYPYDQELALIPGLKLYNLVRSPVCWGNYDSPSETM